MGHVFSLNDKFYYGGVKPRQVDAKVFWGKVVVPTQFQPFRGNMSVETQGRFSGFPGKQKTTKWSKMQHPESNMANPYMCRTGYVGNMMLDDHDGSFALPVSDATF